MTWNFYQRQDLNKRFQKDQRKILNNTQTKITEIRREEN